MEGFINKGQLLLSTHTLHIYTFFFLINSVHGVLLQNGRCNINVFLILECPFCNNTLFILELCFRINTVHLGQWNCL